MRKTGRAVEFAEKPVRIAASVGVVSGCIELAGGCKGLTKIRRILGSESFSQERAVGVACTNDSGEGVVAEITRLELSNKIVQNLQFERCLSDIDTIRFGGKTSSQTIVEECRIAILGSEICIAVSGSEVLNRITSFSISSHRMQTYSGRNLPSTSYQTQHHASKSAPPSALSHSPAYKA